MAAKLVGGSRSVGPPEPFQALRAGCFPATLTACRRHTSYGEASRRGTDDAGRRYPRAAADVRRAAGVRCARKRAARLLRAAGLVDRHRCRRARMMVVEPTPVPAPNPVARESTAPAPDRLQIGDSTYVATREGLLSLVARIDVSSRRVVGRAMADHRRAELALESQAMALQARRPPPGFVHHPDRGCRCQYNLSTLTQASRVCVAHFPHARSPQARKGCVTVLRDRSRHRL